MKWTTIVFTYMCTYVSIFIQYLSVRIYACVCAAVFNLFFWKLELYVFVPTLCVPIPLSSNKSQTKCCVTRQGLLSLWSVSCMYLNSFNIRVARAAKASRCPRLKQFLAFPLFSALGVCTSWMPFFYFFPACVYICKVGVGRANAWSIRNWNGMSQGWLKAKMKYISLGSRGAWGSPVILDNLFFFHLVSSIRTSADLLCWVVGRAVLGHQGLQVPPGARAGEGACDGMRVHAMECGCMQWNAGACSILGMFGVVLLSEDGLDTWGGASQCLAQGSHMPAKDTALGPHLLWCADWK